MDGFQILRCLWKRLDKTLQTVISEFSKTKNQTQKRPPKVLKNKKHLSGGLKSKFFIK